MDDVLEVLKTIGERRDEMLSMLMGLPGNIAPDVVSYLRERLEDMADDLEEAGDLVEHYASSNEEGGCDCSDGPDEGVTPRDACEILSDWARQEDPRTVGKALDAIRGGHVSDLSLIF